MMHGFPDAPTLARALAEIPAYADLRADDLAPLLQKGLNHAHWRLAGRGVIARVRRAGSARAAADALRHQCACFERAAPSGHTPKLIAAVPPSPALPNGVLVVEEVQGRPPVLPTELSLIAEALAAIHALPLPPPEDRPPLDDPPDPFTATLDGILANRAFLDRAELETAARRQIEEEMEWARGFARETVGKAQAAPRALVVTDAHPGNFLITASRHAKFVDLEKGAYGAPAIDLAHATLRPATSWDPDCGTALAHDDIARFTRAYFMAAGPAAEAAIRPWLMPMRRLTWLRTTTVFARFRAERAAAALAPAAAAHAKAVIADALSPAAIATVRREWLGPDALTF